MTLTATEIEWKARANELATALLHCRTLDYDTPAGICRPFKFQALGSTWTAASDGSTMLALDMEVDGVGNEIVRPDVPRVSSALLEEPTQPGAYETDVADLLRRADDASVWVRRTLLVSGVEVFTDTLKRGLLGVRGMVRVDPVSPARPCVRIRGALGPLGYELQRGVRWVVVVRGAVGGGA